LLYIQCSEWHWCWNVESQLGGGDVRSECEEAEDTDCEYGDSVLSVWSIWNE